MTTTGKLYDNGLTYEVTYGDAGDEIRREARMPVLVWDTVQPVAAALNAVTPLTGHIEDFDGTHRPDIAINAAAFMLLRGKTQVAVPFTVDIVGGAIAITFASSIEGRFSIVANTALAVFLTPGITITVNDPAANTVQPLLPMVVTAAAGALTVALDPNDVSKMLRKNIFRQFASGTALTQADRDALLMAIAQKISIA